MTRLRAGRSGVGIPRGARDFSVLEKSIPSFWFTQPPVQWILAAVYPGAKRLGCVPNRRPPSSDEVKNQWSCIFTPSMCLCGVYRDFTLLTGNEYVSVKGC